LIWQGAIICPAYSTPVHGLCSWFDSTRFCAGASSYRPGFRAPSL